MLQYYSALIILIFCFSFSLGQTPVTAITTSSQSATASSYTSSSITYNWGQSNDIYLDAVEISGTQYNIGEDVYGKTIQFKRVDNTSVTGERCQIFVERTNDTNLNATYPEDSNGDCSMIKALSEPIINRGALDVFHNIFDGVEYPNNIERVDVLTKGIFSPTTALLDEVGFFISEKNSNNDYKAAAILSLDENGDPASYGNLLSINGGTAFTNIGSSYNFRYFKDEASSPHGLPEPFFNYTEQVGFSLITFQDLGLSEGQKIYGISFFGKDVDAVSHTLTDPGTFPSNTNEGADMHGGLGSLFHTTNINLNTLIDSDDDGIADADDLDDDNDGILDVVESPCVNTPYLIGSTSASATGAGSSGIPALSYTIPDGSNRMMYLTITVERDHTPSAYGDNWESNAVFTNAHADMPNVSFGGVNTTKLAFTYSYTIDAGPTAPGSATHSMTTYIYRMWNGSMPTGNQSFDFSAFSIPGNAGDEMQVEVYIFAGVGRIEYVNLMSQVSSGSSSWNISGVAEANSQVAGTSTRNNILLAYGTVSTSNGITSGSSGWSEIGSASISNSNGSYAGDPFGISSTENDGISTFFQTITGVTGTQTAVFNATGGGGNELHKAIILYRLIGCATSDADSDGVGNHLDLDSDNDGCADYVEGSGSFYISNGTVAGGMLNDGNGNLVTKNLGNAVDTNSASSSYGVPTLAGAGQGVGDSKDAGTQDPDCDKCKVQLPSLANP